MPGDGREKQPVPQPHGGIPHGAAPHGETESRGNDQQELQAGAAGPHPQAAGAPPGWQQADFQTSQPGSFAHVGDWANGAGA